MSLNEQEPGEDRQFSSAFDDGATTEHDAENAPMDDDATIIELEEVPATASVEEELPKLVLPGNGRPISVCAKELREKLDGTDEWFVRGGSVSKLSSDRGRAVIQQVKPVQMQSLPEKFFKIMTIRIDQGIPSTVPGIMSSSCASALLACEELLKLPELRTLAAAPIILPDGRLILSGFDRDSGIFVSDCPPPARMTVAEACATLTELLVDFDFLTESDRARAIAAIVSPALRFGGHIGRCPIFLCEALESQSGKTLLQSVIAAIYNQTPRIVAARRGGVGSFDESLGAAMFSGSNFVLLDNLRGSINSQYLEATLTADGANVSVRLLRRNEVQIDPRGFVFLATSNSAVMTKDLANRCAIIRIRKRPAGYAFRPYAEGDLLTHVRAQQPRYLGAVFTLINDWIVRDRPMGDAGGHDFREWARALDVLVRENFNTGPLMDGHEFAKQRVSNPGAMFVRDLAVCLAAAGKLDSWLNTTQLYELADEADLTIPCLRTPSAVHGPRAVGKAMKQVFLQGTSCQIDEFLASMEERQTPRLDGNGNRPTKYYRFERVEAQRPRDLS